MFPVRYVSGGLLFLKPLGTFINMILKSDFVNIFCECYDAISTTNISFDFSSLGRQGSEFVVHKPWTQGSVWDTRIECGV
jgi:hypothetical protein